MRQIKLNRGTPLFFLIPISVLIIAFVSVGICSTKVYSNIITMMSSNEAGEMPLSYINSKIKRSTSGKVYIKEMNGEDVLVLTETYEDEEYENWIYCYEGNLYEAFIIKGMELDLKDGIRVMQLNQLKFSCVADSLLEVRVVTTEDDIFTKLIKIKAEVI